MFALGRLLHLVRPPQEGDAPCTALDERSGDLGGRVLVFDDDRRESDVGSSVEEHYRQACLPERLQVAIVERVL